MELTLYKREMKGSWKLLVIFGAVLTMYVAIIISMYEPDMLKLLDSYAQAMPELMAAVGMTAGAADLLGFMISYLYGFILLVFPMAFCILRANGLVAKYVDRGSMACLLAAPVRRSAVALTQAAVLISGTVLLVGYVTGLELAVCQSSFPGELAAEEFLAVNAGLLCLHLFIGGVCFLASCAFSDTKYSLAFGAGVPALMFLLQMLANAGDAAEKARYFTFFTLYDPKGLAAGEAQAVLFAGLLLAGAAALYAAGVAVFCKKDLHI